MRPGSGPGRGGLRALLALAALAPGTLSAQGILEGGRARVDATGDDAVRVELSYTFTLDGSADAIPFEGLAFRPAEVEGLRLLGEGGSTPLELERGAGGRLLASVPVEAGRDGPARVRLAYRVVNGRTGDDPWRLRIPVLAPGWPSAEALPGTFVAEIRTPEGWTLYEPFPSGLLAAEAEAADGPGGRHVLDLPAVPALLSFRATAGTPTLGGMIQFLDGLVVVILGVLVVAGWIHFRSPV